MSVNGLVGAGTVTLSVPWTASITDTYSVTVLAAAGTASINILVPASFTGTVDATISTTTGDTLPNPATFAIYAETITTSSPANGAILIGGTTQPFIVVASNTGAAMPLIAPSFTVQYGNVLSSAQSFSVSGSGAAGAAYTYTGSFSVPQNFFGTLAINFTDGGSVAYTFIYTFQVEQATVTPTLPIVTTVTASALPCAVPYCGNPCSGPCRPSCNRPCNRSSRRSNCRLYGDDASISNFDAEITQPFAA